MTDWHSAAFILDLSHWTHKAWFAAASTTPPGRTPKMVGPFAAMLVKLIAERAPRYLVAAADLGGPTWRHELYAGYKADRPPHPPGYDAQMVDVVRLLELHAIPVIGAPWFESDDVIATLVRRFREAGIHVVVIGVDKDLKQLATDEEPPVCLWDGKDSVTGPAEVVKSHGVTPARLGDLLALTGDAGDGVPGLKGVGPKKAAAILDGTRDLEDAIGLRRWGDSAAAKALHAGADQVRLARKLVTLREDAPITVELEACRLRPSRFDAAGLVSFYEAAGLGHLAARLQVPTAKKEHMTG